MRTTVNQTMQTRLRAFLTALGAGAIMLLAGCSGDKPPSTSTFDFGAPANPVAAARVPIEALVVTDATGTASLDNERMHYRLNYDDPLQARTYANSRWSATPLQMVTQRLKSRIAQAGTKVLGVTDAAAGVPILRIEIDDFAHNFDSAASSHGLLVLRASLFQGRRLVDQKTFTRKTEAGASAAGGARALAASTDAVAADLVAWLATLQLRKE